MSVDALAPGAARGASPRRSRRLLVLVLLAWTVVVVTTAWWVCRRIGAVTERVASAHAETLVGQLRLARAWIAHHGGVYVWTSEETPPNSYLDVPDRDLTVTDGRLLTLINPAYMMRQLAAMSDEMGEIELHLSSLEPINPANRPHDWEERALRAFRAGEGRDAVIELSADETTWRRIEPLWVESRCLKCHQEQGYRVGDLRGGISVTFPIDHLVRLESESIRATLWAAALIWFLGVTLALSVAAAFEQNLSCLQRFAELSTQDTLTEVKNRRGFLDLAGELFGLARRSRSPLLLLFIDVDGLKKINDRHGHAAGDHALIRIANALRAAVRDTDVVARFGGDEFTLLCPGADETDVAVLREKVERALRDAAQTDPRPYSVTASIGHAVFDGYAPDELEELIRRADADMYSAKYAGRSEARRA